MSWKAAALVVLLLLLAAGAALLWEDPDSGTASWDLSRASGFASYLLLWAATVSGVGVHLRWRGAAAPLTVQLEVHRISSTLGVAFLVGHVTALLVDPVVTFEPVDAVVPFTTGYRPLAVGLGTVAQWLLIVVLVSTAMAGRLAWAAWRGLHLLAYPAYVLALVHSIASGTDSGAAVALSLYAGTAALAAAAGIYRLAGRGWAEAPEVR